MRFKRKFAVITGVSRGIGASLESQAPTNFMESHMESLESQNTAWKARGKPDTHQLLGRSNWP